MGVSTGVARRGAARQRSRAAQQRTAGHHRACAAYPRAWGHPPALPPPCQAEEAEEERRLFYVSMTRAKQRLMLLHTKTTSMVGKRWG